jgi:hypothetical protein
MTNWDGQTLADLVQRIRNTMPLDNPGSLSGASTTDLVAYLLQQNGAPAGADDLTGDTGAQSVIRITAAPPIHASLAPAAPGPGTPTPVNGPLKAYARVRQFPEPAERPPHEFEQLAVGGQAATISGRGSLWGEAIAPAAISIPLDR